VTDTNVDRRDMSDRERDVIVDELLAVRCQLGEGAAFDALIERWHEPLWKYARRVTANDEAAADAVQDIWLRAVRGIGRLHDCTRLRAWLFGIARRVLMDRLRDKYAEPQLVSFDESAMPLSEDTTDLDESIALLHEELAQLPLTEREVLVLFYLQELTLGELSEILDIPIGTVKSRLFRARHALRRQLSNKGM
jgi:RNA polymerase sigma-70 factor (ECF subfamily)